MRRLKEKEISDIFKNYTYIIVDSRERDIHIKTTFDQLDVHNIIVKLPYGDYSIMINKCEQYGINEDIRMKVSVERKRSLEEISANLAQNKSRFEREMKRCVDDGGMMCILIEDSSYEDIVNHNYKTELKPKSFLALLHTITARYGVHFIFASRKCASLYIYNYLKYFTKEYLKNLEIPEE